MAYNVGFVVEQALGHITHGENLQKILSEQPDLHALWALPAWETRGLAARLPVYRSNWTVRAGLRTRQALRGLQKQSRLDALFFHTQVTAVLSPDWLRRIPSIVSLDATPLQYDALGEGYGHASGPKWLERGKWELNRLCFREARRIVTWSEWAKQGLVNDYGVPGEKIHVIPPGVNLQEWRPPEKSRPVDETVRILFVGGDLERKGGKTLLEAFRRLQGGRRGVSKHAARPKLELHLVTRSSVHPEPGVFLHQGLRPNTPELKKLFYQADIFCLPSTADCLPMVLSEAGAAGLPLVATDVAAIPEIVREGESGFLIPTGDPERLAAALSELACNPGRRTAMGREAQRLVRARHDARKNARELLDLIRETIEEGHRTGMQR